MRISLPILLVLLLILLALDSRAEARRGVGSPGKVWITDGTFTLEELCKAVAKPELMTYENSVATIYGSFEMRGLTAKLVIQPGETLRFCHVPVPPGENPPPQQVIDRRMFLTQGLVEWKDCTVEGFYWINVDPSVAGLWENVKFIVADDHNNQYDPIELGSCELTWRGGTVDARNCAKTLLPTAPWTKQDVETTIEKVRFLSGGRIVGPVPVAGNSCVYTFQGCTFELSGDPTMRPFHIESHASDLGVFHVKLVDPVFSGERKVDESALADVRGSTAKLILKRGATETVQVDSSPDIHSATDSREFQDMQKANSELRQSFDKPELLENAGSLFWPLRRFAVLDAGLAFAFSAKQYSDRDMQSWRDLNQEVSWILKELSDLWRPGSRYCPNPVPFPTPGIKDEARSDMIWAKRAPDGTVDIGSRNMKLIYNPHGDEHRFACFTADSTIRERPLMDTYPELGAISIRVTGKATSAGLDGHFDWQTQVTKKQGDIAAMEAWIPGGASATIVCFRHLPDVILFDVNSNMVRYQAYAKTAGKKYNGHRFWNEKDAIIERTFNMEKFVNLSDPVRGVFMTSLDGEWYKTKLARGFITAAWHGFNDWESNPPCGCIIRADELDVTWTSWNTAYYSYIVQVNTQLGTGHPNLDDWRESSQVLYVEGKGLGCWENIEALDRAWNKPMELQPVVLEPDKKPKVIIQDKAGIARPAEIVLLPRWCGAMTNERTEIYRGAHTVFILFNQAPQASVEMGELPLELTPLTTGRWKIANNGSMTIPKVHVRIPLKDAQKASVTIAGKSVEPVSIQDGMLEIVHDIPPGETPLQVKKEAAGG
ncbi:MAG TPA: hypothetical protein PLZ55_03000 [bacterium]|nr:hypothetical protein [bacterium]